MDIYLIACFVAIIAIALSLLITNFRLEKISLEVEQLQEKLDE